METMVVKVGNLKEFMEEVQPFSDVRFSQHEVVTSGSPIGHMVLCTDVMGINDLDELIWLRHSIELQLAPGSNKPWTEGGVALYAAYPGLGELVQAYLAEHYTVRPGMYGVAQDIAPLNGELEIVRWDKEAQMFVRVQMEEAAETRLQEAQG